MLTSLSSVQSKLPSTSVYGILKKYSTPKTISKTVLFGKQKLTKKLKTPSERQTSVILTQNQQATLKNIQGKSPIKANRNK